MKAMLGWARAVAVWVFMAFYTQNSGYFGKYTSYFSDFLSWTINRLRKQWLVMSTSQLIMVWVQNQFTTALDALLWQDGVRAPALIH